MDFNESRRKRRRLESDVDSPPVRCRSAVIDLTEDSPEPKDKPQRRKALELTSGASPGAGNVSHQSFGSSSSRTDLPSARLPTMGNHLASLKQEPDPGVSLSDADFARQLQEQFNQENTAIISNSRSGVYGRPSPSRGTSAFDPLQANDSPFLNNSRHSKSSDKAYDDAEFARQLQQQFDQEHSLAISGSNAASQPHDNAQGGSASGWDENPEPTIENPAAKEIQATVREFAQPLIKLKCFKCKKMLFKETDIHSLAIALQAGGKDISCASCRMSLTYPDSEIRAIAIWVLLCSFDSKSKHNKPDKKKKSKAKSALSRYATASNGTGYGHGNYASKKASGKYALSASMGAYAGQSHTLDPAPPTPLNEDDNLTAKVMSCLTELLPSFERGNEFYCDPPTSQLQSLLLCSSILERAADLLRNNDLEDITSRSALYLSLARFVQALSGHPSTSPLTFRERVIRSPGASILQISLGKAKLVELDADDSDTTQPLMQCIQELAIQADMMLKSPDAEATDRMLFRSIKELNDFMLANAGSAKKSTEKNAWHKDLAVSDVPDEFILQRHSLVSKAAPALSRQPGQMKRIMQEIARLKSSLPSGIFVRHCETRPDVMKILIIGPKDTPYENGLFEFDLLCDATFPQGPPRMDFRSTGGGTVHFNPNLYQCGKICLSLLGTWDGEPWDSKSSTLLQVLVSIQAMIFCENPWQNEPGRERYPNAAQQNKSYNRSLYPHTLQTAMLDWLENRSYSKPAATAGRGAPYYYGGQQARAEPIYDTDNIWSEIVRRHFDDNAQDILATVKKWVDEPVSQPAQLTAGFPGMPPIPSYAPNPYGMHGTGQSLGPAASFLPSAAAKALAPAQESGVGGTVSKGKRLDGRTAGVAGRDLVPVLRDAVTKLKNSRSSHPYGTIY